jgi:hypothetical protein
MLCAWLRRASAKPADRRIQMAALAVAILILLPAVSMTDDLVAAQNPAEIDCCARRHHDHDASTPHSMVPAAASLPLPGFARVRLEFAGMTAPGNPDSPFVESPTQESIRNRPPPAA